MARSFRKTRMAIGVGSLSVLSIAWTSLANAQVSCGAILGVSATMSADLACDTSTGPAVTVPSGVVLDMAGHSITCTGGMGSGIEVAGDGATVRNGSIGGCNQGVEVVGDSNRLSGVVVLFSPTTVYGIRVVGDANTLRRCAVRDALTDAFVVAGDGNRLLRNVGVGGGQATFHVESGEANVLADNLAHFSNANGFLLGQATSRTVVVENTAVIGEVGFNIAGSTHKLLNNVALDQNTRGFGVSFDSSGNRLVGNSSHLSGDGFDVVGTSNRLERNSAAGQGGAGLILRGPQNSAERNVAVANQGVDLSDPAGCMNVWTSNVFATSDAACID
jgi:hypothetical protein